MGKSELKNRLFFRKANFVFINLFSSAVLILRSIFFLKVLTNTELGYIILLQAIIGIFGILQLGLFNGGLRFFSIESNQDRYRDINNNITTFILLVTIIFIFGGGIYFLLIQKANILLFLVASVFGGLNLLKNWFSNLMIARKQYLIINKINFWSSFIAVLSALLVFLIGITGAIFSIGIFPLCFICFFLLFNKAYVPKLILIKIKVIKELLIWGFIPYLSGIAMILYNQIDKVFIANILSLKDLGQFYLATIFIRVFPLIPKNLNNLFTPDAINSYKMGNLGVTYKIFYKYLFALVVYSVFVWFLLEVLGNDIIYLLFPEKISQLKYLFILLPGIIATTVSGAFAFLLYVSLHYKALLWNNIFSLTSYLFLLILLILFNKFTLVTVSYVKSFQGILVFLFLLSIYLISKSKIEKFYYLKTIEDKYNLK